MVQFGSMLKDQKKFPRGTCKPMSCKAVLELSAVHKIRTVTHASRCHKSTWLEKPCSDLLEMPSQKFLRSCTICSGRPVLTPKILVFRPAPLENLFFGPVFRPAPLENLFFGPASGRGQFQHQTPVRSKARDPEMVQYGSMLKDQKKFPARHVQAHVV